MEGRGEGGEGGGRGGEEGGGRGEGGGGRGEGGGGGRGEGEHIADTEDTNQAAPSNFSLH